MATTTLVGRKDIIKFTERSWKVIKRWINTRGFPAVKVDGRWESDKDLIREWRKDQLQQGIRGAT